MRYENPKMNISMFDNGDIIRTSDIATTEALQNAKSDIKTVLGANSTAAQQIIAFNFTE